MNQSAPITPQTDKMLSRKEGSVGYVIFNNPERHNAVSLDMWQAAGQMLADGLHLPGDVLRAVATGLLRPASRRRFDPASRGAQLSR